MSNDKMENTEKQMSQMNLTDPLDDALRPKSPSSDASDDSFHSAGNEDEKDPKDRDEKDPKDRDEKDPKDSPQHRLGNDRLSDDLSSSQSQIIEPDGLEGPVSEGTLSEESNFINGVKPKDLRHTPENEEEEEEEEFLNEEYLKDLELSMSEEEKNEKREESQKHKETGNVKFKAGEYNEAITAYTAGLRICPVSFPKDRAILLSNRAAAKAKMGLKKEAIKDCSKAIDLHEVYTKAILRRATLNEETDQLDEALVDFQRVLELDPYNQEALQAVRQLPDKINERNEKLKEEMMGKLKDLGNMILRPFGLSTNNFELKQDPSSGGYNISFNQNTSSGS